MAGAKRTGDSVRDRMFRAAIELFAKKGYPGTTIRDIVQKADVTQPMVYYYFGNKEQLFITCIREINRRINAAYENLDPEKPFKSFMRDFMKANSDAFDGIPEAMFLIARLAFSPDEFPEIPEMKEIIRKPLLALMKAFDNAKKRAEITTKISSWQFAPVVFGGFAFTAISEHLRDRFEIPVSRRAKPKTEDLAKVFIEGVVKK